MRAEGNVLSTSTASATEYGVAQVRRALELRSLRIVHVLFAPTSPRALLLAWVRLENRGDEPTRSGMGLGLFICRELIERQGGKIWAASTPAHGTTMTFTLPFAKTEE